MSLQAHRRDWEDLARLDPFWAILSDPRKRFGRWDPEEFFSTGEAEVAALLTRAEQLGLLRDRNSALDFGCGVGRMTRAFSSRFKRCTGVDIAEGMIHRARELNAAFKGCEFLRNDREDLALFPAGAFDLVYTGLVLQHLPSRSIIGGYLRELVRVLKPGGLLVFQLPSSLRLLRRLRLRGRLYGFLRALGVSERALYGALGVHPIRMTCMPEEETKRILAAQGARLLDVKRDRVAGLVSCVYYASKS